MACYETASTTTFHVSAEHRRVLSLAPSWGVQVRWLTERTKRPSPLGPENIGENRHPRPQRVMRAITRRRRRRRGLRGGWSHRVPGLRDHYATCSSSTARRTWLSARATTCTRARSRGPVRHAAVADAAVVGRPDPLFGLRWLPPPPRVLGRPNPGSVHRRPERDMRLPLAAGGLQSTAAGPGRREMPRGRPEEPHEGVACGMDPVTTVRGVG